MFGKDGPRKKRNGRKSRVSKRRDSGIRARSRFGRYVIRKTIGQGGMGTIYLAHDPVIGREVAIKVITMRPDMGTNEERKYRERFLREARAAGSLVHPNIVAVHDIGQDPAVGAPYIVMEYVPGWDLRKVIETRAPLPARTVLKIGLRIAGALDYAHAQGVVHRDIKPANVLIGERAEVKITDFGVARLAGSDLTRTDQFVGSPGYMAPEQLAGATVDGRADLFALGVVLYQLLTGRLPFDGETVSEILYRIASQPAPPPSSVVRGIPPVFDRILERALAKDPAARYQSGAEMVSEFLSIEIEEAASAAGPRVPDDALAPTTLGRDTAPTVPAAPWWELNSSRRLGGLALFLLLMFVVLTGAVRALSRRGFMPGRSPAAVTSAGPEATRQPAAPERPDPAAAAGRFAHSALAQIVPSVDGLSGAEAQSGNLELRMVHQMSSGRLIVRVDGEIALTAPMNTPPGVTAGAITRRLTIAGGRHDIEIRVLDGDGALRAESMIAGTMPRDRIAILSIEHHAGDRHAMELKWAAPELPTGEVEGGRDEP